jgi:hypothetical protein
MEFDQAKLKDYITTVAFAAVPVILTYQAEIGKYIPMEYALIFTITMGILSQVAANKRTEIAQATTIVNGKIVQTNEIIDEGQAEVQLMQNQLAELQRQIDEKQIEINKVMGIREMVEAPVDGQ